VTQRLGTDGVAALGVYFVLAITGDLFSSKQSA
jgi:hypothetical protein